MKQAKPKILLVDLPSECSQALIDKGFNITNGTLGKPYIVAKSSGYQQIALTDASPNQSEQEIIVIDQLCEKPDSVAKGKIIRPETEPDFWAKCDQGFIDPRIVTAQMARSDFDRILDSGGVFVVFLDGHNLNDLVWAKKPYRELSILENLNWNGLNFLSELDRLGVSNDSGEEIIINDKSTPIGKLLEEHLKGSKFFCTISPIYASDKWKSIAINKHGEIVAIEKNLDNGGSIILLPQIANKSDFLINLLTNYLPETHPKLFPNIEKGKWCHRKEYELKSVLEIQAEKDKLLEETNLKLLDLDRKLDDERRLNGWIHNLLTGTGDELVKAVEKALIEIGFKNVIDVDQERDRAGKSRREDLQILDISPMIIVDVKGINNFPSDEDALQAAKHAMIRMKELNRTDIESLSIINHQRHLPALDRDNLMPFRQEIIDASETQYQGLMSCWDLYRVLINKRKLGWKPEDVKPIFYRSGRFEITPQNYEYIGRITRVWSDKFGLIIEQNELNLGDKISVEFPIEFEEFQINSIFVENKNVSTAKVADKVGLQWTSMEIKLREGLRIFRVKAS